MTLQFLPPALDAYDTAVDDSIATCNGDLRGALKALIIANEFLERDLQKAAFASSAAPSIADDGDTFRKKSTKVNICSEPDTISGCAMAQFGTAPRFLPCSRFFGLSPISHWQR